MKFVLKSSICVGGVFTTTTWNSWVFFDILRFTSTLTSIPLSKPTLLELASLRITFPMSSKHRFISCWMVNQRSYRWQKDLVMERQSSHNRLSRTYFFRLLICVFIGLRKWEFRFRYREARTENLSQIFTLWASSVLSLKGVVDRWDSRWLETVRARQIKQWLGFEIMTPLTLFVFLFSTVQTEKLQS